MADAMPAFTLPAALHKAILNEPPETLPATLLLLCSKGGRILGIAKRIPDCVAIPGGITLTPVSAKRLLEIPPGEETVKSDHSSPLRPLALHLNAPVSCVDAASTLLSAIRSTPLITLNGSVCIEEDASIGTLNFEDTSFVSFDGYIRHPPCDSLTDCGPHFTNENVTDDACHVSVDFVAYVQPDSTAVELKEAISEAIRRVLDSAKSVLAGDASSEISALTVRYFPILAEGTIAVCCMEGEREDEEESIQRRLDIHQAFFLPLDRPLLRRKCALNFDSPIPVTTNDATTRTDGGWEGRLTNVHDGIKGHGLGDKGVKAHLVRGDYLYCHYMQDNLNDSGWGCAYRSLQTLMSWCMLAGYVSFPGGILPTHLQIQQTLVELGDKPQNFIGSRQWIGANEVCYVLEALTGVTSKILHVSKGSEMESKGRELARHFDEQGSPVMVGGGVLAWTILGVARDSRTGKTKFLILDPHYEGRDDLRSVQGKGWVGWKPADIFVATAFYNLCMPMRPSVI